MDASSKEAESSSRNTHDDRWRRTREAGQDVEIGPVNASRTAAAFRRSGTQQIHASAANKPGQVIVMAVRGTESKSMKWPSPTCWRRHAGSSSTTFMVTGSSKSAAGGSLKAMWPFSPKPTKATSIGAAATNAEYRA